MPTTVDRLKTHLGYTGARPVDDEAMTDAVDAANDMVAALRADLPPLDSDPPIVWPPRADEAATLQAAWLYGRRGSVAGVAAFQDVGVSSLGPLDPGVAPLLELGRYQKSAFA